MTLSSHQALTCPWCAEPIELPLDPGQPATTLTEDCPVCCRPIQVCISPDANDEPVISALYREDE